MIAFLRAADSALERVVDFICTVLLIGIVVVVIIAVTMRAFNNAPTWGDTVPMLLNVSMVLLGVGMAVRRRDLIAMQALYERVSPAFALTLEVIWMVGIVIFAAIFTFYGAEVVERMPGFYWELWRLPKKVTAMIMPISGALLLLASIRVLIVDAIRLRTMIRGEPSPGAP